MDILETQAVTLPLEQLVNNEGQIEDVPANPRIIRDEEYNKLKASLQADNLTGVLPLKVYEQDGQYIVLGGNMRYAALRDLGAKDVACIVIPQDTPAQVLRKIVQLDNATFGEWDWDALANEWDADELQLWGVNIPDTEDAPAKDVKDLSDQLQIEYKVEVSCINEADQEQLFNKLTGEGYECRLLTL